jgi:Protein of unknown function (DUF998)
MRSRCPSNSLLRTISLLGVGGFLAATVAEHVLDSQLDPARHMISEYVNGPYGAVMVAGFVMWAISLAATAWLALRAGGIACGLALALACVSAVIVSGFATQTTEGRLRAGQHWHLGGRLHDIGSGTLTVALALAALGCAVEKRVWQGSPAWNLGVIITALIADAALLLVGSDVGGIRERVLVLLGCSWQLALIARMRAHRGAPA